MRRLPALAAACLVSIAVAAQAPAPPAPEAPAKPAPPAARISELSWPVGYWVGWEEKDKALRLRLNRREPGVFAFGGVTFEQKGESGLVVRLVIRQKDGTQRLETLAYRLQAL